MAVKYSDIELYVGVRERDNKVLTHIYKHFFPLIESLITSNQGDTQEAQDIFQEALIITYRKLKNKEVDVSGSFKSYIYSIAKFLWFRKLKSGIIRQKYVEEIKSSSDVVNDVTESYITNQKYKLFQKHFNKLDWFCQRILQMQLQKLSYEEIAKNLGKKDPEYIKSKKYKCKEILIKNIKNDPEYKDIYLDDFLDI
ncbi:MAG: sigma-70 family RNA polymerase sigma factor [Bacteroidales bacterium]|nr:sigma-70 family RNA polymerase sigma factor [Bacteroidales bacterium]